MFLADFDIEGGTISFTWRLNHSYSVLDALRNSEKLDTALGRLSLHRVITLTYCSPPNCPRVSHWKLIDLTK